ncbi:hypothetical protein, partial [Streptomyces parvus]|uniref:hypothetical protein n=1 Tax=Streptomyces parvus TaxID=66428 RepID=UPI00362D4CFA
MHRMIPKPGMGGERQPSSQRHPVPVNVIQNRGEQRMPRTHLTRHRHITGTTRARLQPIPTTLKRIRRQINNPTTPTSTCTTRDTQTVEHRTPINIKPPHPQPTQRTHHTPHLITPPHH